MGPSSRQSRVPDSEITKIHEKGTHYSCRETGFADDDSNHPAAKETEDVTTDMRRAYEAFHDTMMDAYYADEDDRAQNMAEFLLHNAECPQFHRTCAHIVLATYLTNPCVWHATQAIRILQPIYMIDPVWPQGTIQEAGRLLKDAEAYCRFIGRSETNYEPPEESMSDKSNTSSTTMGGLNEVPDSMDDAEDLCSVGRERHVNLKGVAADHADDSSSAHESPMLLDALLLEGVELSDAD